MKYFIDLGVRAKGVQLIELTEEEKDELLEGEDLDDIYDDWVDKIEYEFALENYYLTPSCDRFTLTIRDEDDEVVYEVEDVDELVDRTYDNEGEVQVKGWEFEGFKDGYYLTRLQTIKGCCCSGEFELDEDFDASKLYLVQDKQIEEELVGDTVFPLFKLYYQKGEGYDIERDVIELEFESDLGEQYYDTYLCSLKELNWWTNLKE